MSTWGSKHVEEYSIFWINYDRHQQICIYSDGSSLYLVKLQAAIIAFLYVVIMHTHSMYAYKEISGFRNMHLHNSTLPTAMDTL